MKVSFLGLGAMGMPMAVNVARAGHQLTLWNRSERPLDGFGEARPVRAPSIPEAVRDSEAVITMLADDGAVQTVVQSPLETLADGAVHVGMSTVGIDPARRLTEAHRQRRRAYVDPKAFVDAANAIFQARVYANHGGAVAEGRTEPALFKAVLGRKDLRLALAAADELAVPMPAAGVAHDSLLSAVARGQGDKDWTVLDETARPRAGLA